MKNTKQPPQAYEAISTASYCACIATKKETSNNGQLDATWIVGPLEGAIEEIWGIGEPNGKCVCYAELYFVGHL